MLSKLQVLSFVYFIALPLAVDATTYCTFEFYSSSDCSGSNVGTCDPAANDNQETTADCYWNTYVGSISYSCDDTDSPAFAGCYGDPEGGTVCDDAWSIAIPDTANGCQVIGTYDGVINVYDNNVGPCTDCIGT